MALRKRIFSLDQHEFPGFEESQEKDSKNTSGAKMGGLSTIDSQNEFSKVSEGRKSIKSRKSFKNVKREEVVQIKHESPALNLLEDEPEESEENSPNAFDDDELFDDFADKFSKNEDLEYLRYNRVKS